MALAWRQDGATGQVAGPWRIGKCRVGGELRFTLTHDEDARRWCGLRLLNMRHFASGEAARAAAEGVSDA